MPPDSLTDADSPARLPGLRSTVLAGWLVVLVVVATLWWRSDVTAAEIPGLLHDWLSTFGLGRAAALYVVLYIVRPLVLFPATLLTITSGMLFGPWLGMAFTIVGENASATVAFLAARWLGRGWVQARKPGSLAKWEPRLRDNGLMTVLIMRLIYLPYDAVNYACGLTSMRWRDFALGTAIGIMPGLVSFVLLGGTAASGVDNRAQILGASIAFFLLGLLVAWRLRRRPAQG